MEKINDKKIGNINSISFLMGLSTATLTYITSSYLQTALGTSNIGIFYLFSYAAVLAVLLIMHRIIRLHGKSNTFLAFLAAKIASLILLVLIPPSAVSPFLLGLFIISSNLAVVCLDILLESFSVDRKSGRIRGMHLMILDIGFIFGPLISTKIVELFNYQAAFLLTLLIEIAILAIALANLRHIDSKVHAEIDLSGIIKKVFRHRNILRIYYISLILEFFYAIMIIYSPIYLRYLGMSWQDIGLVFTAMLVPFVILPYPVGYIADKKLGEKEMLIISIFVMSVSTGLAFLLDSPNIYAWAIVLFLTRIGASMIQTLRDSYFYKRIDGNDVELIDFFRTSGSVGYIAAAILSFVLLIFLPTKFVFLLLALVSFSGLYPALRLQDNKSEAETGAEGVLVSAAIIKS